MTVVAIGTVYSRPDPKLQRLVLLVQHQQDDAVGTDSALSLRGSVSGG